MFIDKFFVLKAAKEGDVYHSLDGARKAGANVFAYRHFIQTIVDFFIIAFFIFIAIQFIARLKAKEEAANAAQAAGRSSTDQLLMKIRDLLKKNKHAQARSPVSKQNILSLNEYYGYR
jgi:large conductance mechanosensitive channel